MINNDELIKELMNGLKKDEEIANVSYNKESNLVVVGMNPNKMKPDISDEDEIVGRLMEKTQKLGDRIAMKSRAKYFDNIVSAEEFVISFSPKFVEKGRILRVGDECWSRENPTFAS
jgi:hypothetical protein